MSKAQFLKWTAVENATAYRVAYASTADGTKTELSGSPVTIPQIILTGITPTSAPYLFIKSSGTGYADSEWSAAIPFVGLLEAPTIALDGDSLTISLVANAMNYDIYANNALIMNVLGSSVDMTALELAAGTYTITVKAKADGFQDSEFSHSVSYTVAPVEYQLSGKWVFNEPVWPVFDVPTNINFTSNNESFTGIKMIQSTNGPVVYYISQSNSSGIIVYDAEDTYYWNIRNVEYQTVDFGSTPKTVSAIFYNWFTANAVQQVQTYTLTVCHEPWAENVAYLYLSFDNGNTWMSFDNLLNEAEGNDGRYAMEIPNVSTFKAYYVSSVPVDYAFYTTDGSSPNLYFDDQVRVDIKSSVSPETAATVTTTADTMFTFILYET